MPKFREVRRYPDHIKQFLDKELPGWDDMMDDEFQGGVLSVLTYKASALLTVTADNDAEIVPSHKPTKPVVNWRPQELGVCAGTVRPPENDTVGFDSQEAAFKSSGVSVL